MVKPLLFEAAESNPNMDLSFCHCDWSHSEIYLITAQVIEGFLYTTGFPGGAVVKKPPANAGNGGDKGSIPGSGRSPWRKKWQPTPIFLPGKSHGQRSLVGYSPWGCKELNTSE